MKIAGIEATKERMMIAAAAAAVVIGAYFIFYMPLAARLAVKGRTYAVLEKQIGDAKAVIASAGPVIEDRGLLRENEVTVAIDDLTKHGKAMGVTFESIRPRELAQDQASRLKMLPVELVIAAGDREMVAFLGSFDDLTRNIVTINSFDITPGRDDPSRLRANMTVTLYFLPGDAPQGK